MAAPKKYVWGTKDGKRVRVEAGRAARIRRRIEGSKPKKWQSAGGGSKPKPSSAPIAGGGGVKPGSNEQAPASSFHPKPKPGKPKPHKLATAKLPKPVSTKFEGVTQSQMAAADGHTTQSQLASASGHQTQSSMAKQEGHTTNAALAKQAGHMVPDNERQVWVPMRVKGKDGKYRWKNQKVGVSKAKAIIAKRKAAGSALGPGGVGRISSTAAGASSPSSSGSGAKPKPAASGGGAGGKGGLSPLEQAVQSVIASQIAPLKQAQAKIESQTGSNIMANQSLTAQTQGTLATLLENARRGTGQMMLTAAQEAAATRGSHEAAAQQLQNVFGPAAMNEQTRAMLRDGLAPSSAALNANAVENVYGSGLGGQLQQDFFQRAQAVSAVTQQAFNQGQRDKAAAAIRDIAAQIAAAKGQAGALRRQYGREDAQAELEQATAEQAFGMKVAELNQNADIEAAKLTYQQKLAQAKLDLEAGRLSVSQYNATTSRLNAQAAAAKGPALTAMEKPGIYGSGIPRKFDEAITRVQKDWYDGQKPDKDGKIAVKKPWRDAFDALTGDAGLSRNAAALVASRWSPGSLTSSTAKKIVKMLKNRGVSPKVQKQIVDQAFGPGAYAKALKTANSAPLAGNFGEFY